MIFRAGLGLRRSAGRPAIAIPELVGQAVRTPGLFPVYEM